MNKHRRHELKMLKYKKRLRMYKVTPKDESSLYAFRSHSCPCSCMACQQPESGYNRAKESEILRREVVMIAFE